MNRDDTPGSIGLHTQGRSERPKGDQLIPFFTGYAMAVWFAAAVWRRQWRSFAAVALGVAGLIGIIKFHAHMGEVTQGRIYTPVLNHLLVGYTVLVGGMGLFLAVVPRRREAGHCTRCGYDLSGASSGQRVCPECATPFAPHPDDVG